MATEAKIVITQEMEEELAGMGSGLTPEEEAAKAKEAEKTSTPGGDA